MRKAVVLVLGILLGIGVMTAAVAAETVKIGIVDLSILLTESRAGKDANAQLTELITARQSELDEREAAVLALQTELNEATDLSDADRARKEEELNTLVTEYLALAEVYEAEIQNLAETLRNQLLNEIGAVLQWYGDQREYTAILDVDAVLYYRRVVDLTWDILREYDELKAAGRI